jgi:DNA recombination protein RmuC
MIIAVLVVSLAALLLVAVGLVLLLRQGQRLSALDRLPQDLQAGMRPASDSLLHAKDTKDTVLRMSDQFVGVHERQQTLAENLQRILDANATAQSELQKLVIDNDERQRRELDERLKAAFSTNSEAIIQLRTETLGALDGGRLAMTRGMTEMRESNEKKLAELNQALKSELATVRQENAEKLEAMRQTVDEKLHETLEQRLGESFKLVSDRLEQVHRGLGEMQSLATGVGDLRKVLTNIKTRGTWGEVQLENLLDQILTADQYEKNVATRPGSAARVEFALKMPGKSGDRPFYLPIDAKFPLEDYQRLTDAQDRADPVAVEEAGKALEVRIRGEGRSIRDKYVEPPHTTDFAVLYLSTEGLYAEVLRRPGLADWLQRECKVVLSGPTTLAAMLNSLQMGFRTLAIEKRSSEVWQVLGAVKTEFSKFGEALAHTKKKLEEATNSLDKAQTRSNAVTRKLKSVEQLPEPGAVELLPLQLDMGAAGRPGAVVDDGD